MSEPTPVPDGYVPISEYLTQNGIDTEKLRNVLSKYQSEQPKTDIQEDWMAEFWEYSYLSEIQTFAQML